jgi:hypothetical protein
MVDSKEVAMFITGVYGLQDLHFKTMNSQSGLLTANLELKVCLFGSPFNSLHQNRVDHMHPRNCYLMKDTTLNFTLSENTCKPTQKNRKASNWKHIKVDLSKPMQYKSQSKRKEHLRTTKAWAHCIGSSTMPGLQSHGLQLITQEDGNHCNTKQNNCMKT